jgi:aspartyl-tRNA(Asn)/glutamyl-tRNA(Gln) amidotransferase subunit A
MSDLASDPYASIVELSKAVQKKSVLPSEIVEAQLTRIEAIDPKLGSYQTVYRDAALSAAREADTAIANNQRIGPFHGIPFALKDIFELEGQITTCGSREMLQRISLTTGTVVRRLLEAGGIVIGKTKTVECALGGWGTNEQMGTPWNPWDLKEARVPGGSSSGSGVAVASGLASCATGSDTGGSVRLPAAFCGLTGLKVSKACLPTDGIMPLSQTLDTPGPMTRNMADLALMFSIMQGTNTNNLEKDMMNGHGLFSIRENIFKGLKLGIIGQEERSLCTDSILESYDTTLDLLVELGAELKIFKPPIPYDDLAQLNGAITMYEGYQNHRNFYDDPRKKMDRNVKKRMMGGCDLTSEGHTERLQNRQDNQLIFKAEMAEFHALLTPTVLEPAPRLIDIDEDFTPGYFTRPFNYIDMTALALPTTYSKNGLPTSMQIVAPAGQENFVIQLGTTLEKALALSSQPNFSPLYFK